MIPTALTLDYLGNPMAQSPSATNGVIGTTAGQTLTGKKGVSNWMISGGGGSILIGGDSGDTFYIRDTADIVIAAAGTINTVVSWAPEYVLPANVQNLIVQVSGVGVGNDLDNLLVAQGGGTYTLVAGTGNDVLVGNASGDASDTGGSTTFVIAHGDGNDVISNFANGVDTLRLAGFSNFTSLASVQAAMTQVGSDVVLQLDATETLTFRNETISAFQAPDFQLTASLTGMTLRFDDEFNSFTSSPYGTQGWMTQGGGVWRTLGGNNEAEYYSDSSVGVNPFSDQNGVLTITAAPGSNPLGLPYNSGIITTEKSLNFEYGLIEVSAKLPAGNGMWPAIWLLPSNLTWPPEIDVMEMLGNDPSQIYVGTHSGSGNTATTTEVYVGDTTSAFHTYAVDWEPNTITWYFDGVKIFAEATPADMHQPMYVLINLAIGGAGSWPGAPTSASEFPASMSINWVRYYASANSLAVSGTQALAGGAATTLTGDQAAAGGSVPVPPPPAPGVTSVTTAPGNGVLKAGASVTFTLSFASAVIVSGGVPTLRLNDGGTATYVSGSGSLALVFTTTVLAGQNTADLALAASGAIALNGATLVDAYGQSAVLTGADGANPTGTLAVDTTPPSIVSVAMTPGSGIATLGSVITVTSTFSEAVTVSGGKPSIALTDGGTATYVSGSGTTTLVFTTTVAAGQNATDLALAASNAIALNGASITDVAGNAADLSGANGLNPAGVLAVQGGPLVRSLTVSGWWNSYAPGPGLFVVGGSAGGGSITLGDGNQIVNVTGTNNTLTTGDGRQTVIFHGDNNTVTTGAGASTITLIGNYETVHAGATLSGTTVINASGFAEHITAGAGNVTVIGPNANSTVSLGDGNDLVTLAGSGNTVSVGVGTSVINAGIGQAVVHAGGGAVTINVTGYSNLLDAGPGMNFLNGGSGNDTFVLNGAGQGLDTIKGFTLTNHDILDLTRTLATATTKVDLTNIGKYLTTLQSSAGTTLLVDPTGGAGKPTAFALLSGVQASVAQLVAHGDLKLA